MGLSVWSKLPSLAQSAYNSHLLVPPRGSGDGAGGEFSWFCIFPALTCVSNHMAEKSNETVLWLKVPSEEYKFIHTLYFPLQLQPFPPLWLLTLPSAHSPPLPPQWLCNLSPYLPLPPCLSSPPLPPPSLPQPHAISLPCILLKFTKYEAGNACRDSGSKNQSPWQPYPFSKLANVYDKELSTLTWLADAIFFFGF